MEVGPGTYLLGLYLPVSTRLRVGALGTPELPAGSYFYVGSALGPGGIAARLRHHVRRSQRPHWHIDYLRREADLVAALISEGSSRRECRWAAALEAHAVPVLDPRGFGASDCACGTHLFAGARWPGPAALLRRLREPLGASQLWSARRLARLAASRAR
jgi:Uri superfamily endonuclease